MEEHSTHKVSGDKLRTEEVRGLFVLGLLAIMIVVRYQNSTLPIAIGSTTFDLVPILDITIMLWSLYAFMMVLGLSGDVIGKALADSFWELATTFLRFNFMLLALLSTLLAYLAYPTRSPWIFGIIFAAIVFGGIKWLIDLQKKPLHFELKKRIKANFSFLSGLMLLVSITAILYLPDAYEQYIVLPFIISLIAIGLYYLTRKKN